MEQNTTCVENFAVEPFRTSIKLHVFVYKRSEAKTKSETFKKRKEAEPQMSREPFGWGCEAEFT